MEFDACGPGPGRGHWSAATFDSRTANGPSHSLLYAYGTCNGTKGFFRSTDAGARWDQIASQYLPNNYIFDNVKDIDGDKIDAGKVYVILGGTSLVYGPASREGRVTWDSGFGATRDVQTHRERTDSSTWLTSERTRAVHITRRHTVPASVCRTEVPKPNCRRDFIVRPRGSDVPPSLGDLGDRTGRAPRNDLRRVCRSGSDTLSREVECHCESN
jgi:hypothetical protein